MMKRMPARKRFLIIAGIAVILLLVGGFFVLELDMTVDPAHENSAAAIFMFIEALDEHDGVIPYFSTHDPASWMPYYHGQVDIGIIKGLYMDGHEISTPTSVVGKDIMLLDDHVRILQRKDGAAFLDARVVREFLVDEPTE